MQIKEVPCGVCGMQFPNTLLQAGKCRDCREKEGLALAREEMKHADEKQKLEEAKKLKKAEDEAAKRFTKKYIAQQELAKRELARRHLLPFVTRFTPDYTPGWVHVDICHRLEQFVRDVADKKSPRLALFMPPRHGKSQITSKRFPAWVLGQYPHWEFMSCSYSGALANNFSRDVRQVMRDPAYHALFPTRLDPDYQSVEQWMTTDGGGLVAAGVGGAITGKGAHILVIDDPVKNREDADSEVAREACWNWYTSTAYTRLAPGGGVLVIQTRWHDDDLSGRLIAAMEDGGDQFEIIDYPAIAEQDEKYRRAGEALHPERYSEKALERIRKAIGERDWWALYQQKPVSDEGAYFQKSWFQFYDVNEMADKLHECTFYTAWDFAIGTKEVNDYTVGITVALDRANNLYVVDMRRGHWDGGQIVEEIIDTWETWGSMITGMEKGQIEMALGPFLKRRVEERGAWGFNYEPMPTGRRDKQARARTIQGMLRAGKVFIPRMGQTPWATVLMNELLRFPTGANDDCVDAMAWVGLLIEQMSTLPVPKTPKAPSWKDKLDKYIKSDTSRRTWLTA